MANKEYKNLILNRINNEITGGEAFTITDFQDIASQNTINQTLVRLVKEKKIRRVIKGVYDKPEYSQLLKEYSAPRMDKVAEAIARKYNWSIAPTGNTALNMLHLSTQVTNTWEYASDGPNRTYEICNMKIKFNSVMKREITGFHKITVMIIQALRKIGEKNITDQDIKILKNTISEKDKKIILEESKTSRNWIYEVIKIICKEE